MASSYTNFLTQYNTLITQWISTQYNQCTIKDTATGSTIITVPTSTTNAKDYWNVTPIDTTTPTDPTDKVAPTLATANYFSPADDATNVPINSDITITFNENIKLDSTKTIGLYDVATNTLVPAAVTADKMVVTINPTAYLAKGEKGTEYYVTIAAGAVEDSAGNDFAGILDKTKLSFTTIADGATPTGTIVKIMPADAGKTTNNVTNTDQTFEFEAGSYTHTISGFNKGDKIDFPTGTNLPTLTNSKTDDGKIDFTWANGGQILTITVTGIPTADDEVIYGLTSWKSIFPDSLITI